MVVMSAAQEPGHQGYEGSYAEFNSPLQQRLRREAYGQDIGQHSWVTAEELEQDIPRLKLSRASRLLDLGCGPGGPLAFVGGVVGCEGNGIDLSSNAIAAGRARLELQRLSGLITLQEADLNQPLGFANSTFDAVMSLDVVLHLRDRAAAFREVARVLIPGGRFLFTDAGVKTGAASDEELRLRSVHGYTQFVLPGFNERTIESAGMGLIETCDRTASLLKSAKGRLKARLGHREEIEAIEGKARSEQQEKYLETVIELAQRGSMSRMMYLAESRAK
jgi:SAM-dependent methyltransferase